LPVRSARADADVDLEAMAGKPYLIRTLENRLG